VARGYIHFGWLGSAMALSFVPAAWIQETRGSRSVILLVCFITFSRAGLLGDFLWVCYASNSLAVCEDFSWGKAQ
jgi:hypothetical protein